MVRLTLKQRPRCSRVDSQSDHISSFCFPLGLDERLAYRIESTDDPRNEDWTLLNEKPAGLDWSDPDSIAGETIGYKVRPIFVPEAPVEDSETDSSRFHRVLAMYGETTVALPTTTIGTINLQSTLAEAEDVVILPEDNYGALSSLRSEGVNDLTLRALILDGDTFVDSNGIDSSDNPIRAGEGFIILTDDELKFWMIPSIINQ